ncbi:MAG: deoxycytidylate deaminase [Candidatus Hodarchaeales archaeon]|jgi:dCMP deaminase
MTRPSWDDTWVELAQTIAKRSKDQSTKIGCVIVGPDQDVRSTGYNCFPRGLDDERPERQVRPEKYSWIEHAERNAIFNVVRRGGASLKGCTIYISQFLPCSDCARAIIQTGITDVVVTPVKIPKRWSKDFKLSAIMLHEAGVRLRYPNQGSDDSQLSVFD